MDIGGGRQTRSIIKCSGHLAPGASCEHHTSVKPKALRFLLLNYVCSGWFEEWTPSTLVGCHESGYGTQQARAYAAVCTGRACLLSGCQRADKPTGREHRKATLPLIQLSARLAHLRFHWLRDAHVGAARALAR
jgi:hypothetical protein